MVKVIARVVIKLTERKYLKELLGALPADLCQTIITDGNINQIIARINSFQGKKEDAFAKKMGLGLDWGDKPKKRKELQKLLDSSNDELSFDQESLKREAKFLSNLSRSIYELRFVKLEKQIQKVLKNAPNNY